MRFSYELSHFCFKKRAPAREENGKIYHNLVSAAIHIRVERYKKMQSARNEGLGGEYK